MEFTSPRPLSQPWGHRATHKPFSRDPGKPYLVRELVFRISILFSFLLEFRLPNTHTQLWEPGSTLLARRLCSLLPPPGNPPASAHCPQAGPAPQLPQPMVSLLSHRDRAGHDPRHQPGDGHVLGHVTLEFHGDHGRVTHPCVYRHGFLVGGDPETRAHVLKRRTA